MFRVMIWGQSAIVLALAAIAYIMINNSENLKNTLKGKLIVILIVLLAVVLFLLSFDTIRSLLARFFF